ncbi:MAG: Fic family protein [Clostridiales bacterium]|jgi:Fic family protein|nr:Fic family protein [Clostridiales bacterium]
MDFKRVDALAEKLRSLRPLNEAELKRVRDDFIIENTYDSNAIEGSTLTLRETALILREGITIGEKPLKAHLEAIGHKDAFEYILMLTERDTPLTERIIKEIHSLVLMSDFRNKGVYRSIPVYIKGAAHTPPQPYLVQPQMEALIADYGALKRERRIYEAIAEFHLRFEGIHPFIDGNGRTGRLIMNFELIKAGLLPINIKFTDRRKYYDCFDSYYGGQGTDALTGLIAGCEAAELEWFIDILKNTNNYGE